MNVVFSKVASKNQTVIPREVRQRLKLGPGDRLRYSLTPEGISVTKADNPADDDLFAVFAEWATPADEEAYGSL